MAMKAVLDSLDGLSDDVKAHYKEQGGKFYLDVEDGDSLPNFTGLKGAKENEVKSHGKTKEKLTASEVKITELQDKLDDILRGNVPKGDLEALETSYKTKLGDQKSKLEEKISTLSGQVTTLLVDNKAREIADRISTAPELMLPHIQRRLKVEEDADGHLTTRVLDKEGKVSASNIEDLENELFTDKSFAPIIVGSRASGSGTSKKPGGGGAAKKLSDLSERERTDLAKSDPQGFQRLVDEDAAARN